MVLSLCQCHHAPRLHPRWLLLQRVIPKRFRYIVYRMVLLLAYMIPKFSLGKWVSLHWVRYSSRKMHDGWTIIYIYMQDISIDNSTAKKDKHWPHSYGFYNPLIWQDFNLQTYKYLLIPSPSRVFTLITDRICDWHATRGFAQPVQYSWLYHHNFETSWWYFDV